MKLLELAEKPDDRAVYRSIALAANSGGQKTPLLAAPVELWESTATTIPSKEDAEKLVGKLRSGLASVDMGRFTVERIGAVAWVSVNQKPVRTRRPKAATKQATPPRAKKAAAAK